MWPLLVAGAAGFLAAGRTQPKTKCERKVVLGARTGRTYEVEEFPQAGFLVVRTTGIDASAYGVFQHVQPKAPGDPRFSWRGGKGSSESLHGMCIDLGIVREQPSAVSPQPSAQTADSRPQTARNGPQTSDLGSGSGAQDAGRKTHSAPNNRGPRSPSEDERGGNVVQHPAAQKTGS